MSSGAPASATSAALAPPPGVQSNFNDPPSIQPAVIGALSLCIGISTLSVLVRCYAQWTLAKRLVWADFWMLLGWAFQVVFVGLLYACLPYGGGRHLWDVTKGNFAHIQYLLFIDYIIYGCAVLGPKISILLQLIAIFVPRGRGGLGTGARWFYWSAQFLIATNLIFYVAHNFTLIFQCNPIAKGWIPSLPGVCMNQVSLLESSGPFNIISDFLIFLLPLSSIWQLKLPVRTRLGIVSAFAVGLFGCICSAVRLYYSSLLNSSGDATYLVFQNQLWANAEITSAVLIANIIILPRFIRFKRGTGSTYDHTARTASRNNRTSKSRRSMGLQHSSKFIQRKSNSDPYIELTESFFLMKLRRTLSTLNEEHELEKGTGPGMVVPDQGIMRTIHINTVEETLNSPTRAGPDVVTEVRTGNNTGTGGARGFDEGVHAM